MYPKKLSCSYSVFLVLLPDTHIKFASHAKMRVSRKRMLTMVTNSCFLGSVVSTPTREISLLSDTNCVLGIPLHSRCRCSASNPRLRSMAIKNWLDARTGIFLRMALMCARKSANVFVGSRVCSDSAPITCKKKTRAMSQVGVETAHHGPVQ